MVYLTIFYLGGDEFKTIDNDRSRHRQMAGRREQDGEQAGAE